jgi:membrane protease YdiL (CAAX protease family)
MQAIATPGRIDSEARAGRWLRFTPDRTDLLLVAGLYLLAVATFRIAFRIITTDSEIPLFIVFGIVGLLGVGVTAPVAYTVWYRKRPLADLGVGAQHWRSALALGLLLAGVQFALTLWGYDLPRAEDWVPLLLMSVVVGLFEAVFFRGFIQTRLEGSFGIAPAILGAATLYALYHVGYGMGAGEMLFLFFLGIGYAAAFRLVGNILVLWPLLIPLGSFFNNLEAGNIELPWASMIGFGEVLVAMGVVLWFAHRYARKHQRPARPASSQTPMEVQR